jgi:alkanesulfonate monooxygenase SsuD/methylene tetrahydromethanopterin reductase-like flavin-dependent oxidoreductase (luciferase family)
LTLGGGEWAGPDSSGAEDQVISKFSVIYTGAIDLGNVGRDGTPADERRYSNERLVEALYNSEALAEHLDKLGYFALWGAEHHFQREGYECIPNLILWAVHLAGRTRNLKFGCAFNIIPTWHPIRLAEDFAMADVFTRGRVIFGLGRGYQSREVEGLGAPLLDSDANRELYEESLEIILKAWSSDSFRHDGKHYTIPPRVPYRGYDLEEVTLVPRPINRPVEIWQPISSGKTLSFIARQGIKGMVAYNGDKLTRQVFTAYRDEAAMAGRNLQLGEDLALGLAFYLGDSKQAAIESVRPYHDERFKWFSKFGLVRYVDDDGRMWGTPGAPARLPHVEDGVAQRAWLCGTPDEVVAELKAYEAEYPGLDQVVMHWPEGIPPAEFLQQLTWFAESVMPHFRSAVKPTGVQQR